MNAGRDIAVVIPVYQTNLSPSESYSLERTAEILQRYPIYIVHPQDIDISALPIASVQARSIAFPSHFFRSIVHYNRLMMSTVFYSAFRQFRYILIVQLDALVISDKLEEWCEYGFSYVGAPWFSNSTRPGSSNEMIGSGNGGFSLRRVEHFLRVLRSPKYLPSARYKSRSKSKVLAIIRFVHNNLIFAYNLPYLKPKVNEDIFWGRIVTDAYDYFSSPSAEQSARFSFEDQPRQLFHLTNGELPFGCHAWEKYDPEFWHEVIDDLPVHF